MNEDERIYSVYVHTFPNGKRYVGMTLQNPTTRWGNNGYGYKGQPYVFNAIKKYGWENISHDIVQTELTCEEAEALERELIKEYRSAEKGYGYNVDLGGKHQGKYSEERRRQIGLQQRGRKASPETRKRLSESLKGHKVSQETREKLRQKNLGKKATEETRRKISEANKARGEEWREKLAWYARNRSPETIEKIRAAATGVKQSPEIIEKRAAAMRGRKCSDEHIAHMIEAQNNRSDEWENKRLKEVRKAVCKPVLQYSMDGQLICEWPSAADAWRETGIDFSKISACCRGARKSTGGYQWKFKEEGSECA